MTLSRRIGVVEISTLWLFRYLQLAKKRIKVVSFHRLSRTGMILSSPLLKRLMTVCPSSHLLREPGTNFPPGAPALVRYCQFGVSRVNHSDSELLIIHLNIKKRFYHLKFAIFAFVFYYVYVTYY